jgi:hypothetical protein
MKINFCVLIILIAAHISAKADSDIEAGTSKVTGRIPTEFMSNSKIGVMLLKWYPDVVEEPSCPRTNWNSCSQPVLRPDPNGCFTFSNLQPGKYVIAVPARRMWLVSEIFEVSNGQTQEIKFKEQNSTVQIRFVDEDQNPVPKVACQMADEFGYSFVPTRPGVLSDVNGIVKFERISTGIYSVCVMKDGFLPVSKENIQVDSNNISFEIVLKKSAVVKFVLDESIKKMITKPYVMMYCGAVNTDTNEPYKWKIYWNEIDKIPISLHSKNEWENSIEPKIDLPTGNFMLNYEIVQRDDLNNLRIKIEPFFTGKTEVALTTGQTIEVIIK